MSNFQIYTFNPLYSQFSTNMFDENFKLEDFGLPFDYELLENIEDIFDELEEVDVELQIEVEDQVEFEQLELIEVQVKCELENITPWCRIPSKNLETRKQKIDRYLYKKSRRCWGKNFSYDIRSKFAVTRPRYKGRFIKK